VPINLDEADNVYCVVHEICSDILVMTGYSCFHSNTIIPDGFTVEIQAGGEFIIIGTGG